MRVKTVFWVAAGGACGAVLRYAVQAATASASLPWGTFLANVAGCLAIGALLAVFVDSPWFEAVGRPFLVVGVLGAFTTFSAFSADTMLLYQEGRLSAAAGYAVGTMVLCLGAAFVGFRLGGAIR